MSECAREGCRFPISSEDSIKCCHCEGRYHGTCSNLSPREFHVASVEWSCPKCSHSSNNNHSCSPPSKKALSNIISYVTSNPNKLRETIECLGSQFSDSLKAVNIDLPEYQGSVEEIASLKCKYALKKMRGPVLVEDTGLGFDAMHNLPGPYIKWFLKAVGPAGLHKMVLGFGPQQNQAQAVCTFAFCEDEGEPVQLFQGVTRGRIVEPKGMEGFGWDPCFQPDDGEGLTYAEMGKEKKNTISHRCKAVAKLGEFLENRLSDSQKKTSSVLPPHFHSSPQSAQATT